MCGQRPASNEPCGDWQGNDGSGRERGMLEESRPVSKSPGLLGEDLELAGVAGMWQNTGGSATRKEGVATARPGCLFLF